MKDIRGTESAPERVCVDKGAELLVNCFVNFMTCMNWATTYLGRQWDAFFNLDSGRSPDDYFSS